MKNPLVMGVLNVTPDSFSDGGKFFDVEKAVSRAGAMIEERADIIDIGGESTGPGSPEVSAEEELKRVIPVITEIHRKFPDARLSIDAYTSEVVKAALEAGCSMVNDVTALRGDPQMAATIAAAHVPVILMYSKDPTPRTTRDPIEYDNVVATIKKFLAEQIAYAESCGIKKENMIIDPGMGAFVSGRAEYSFEILRRLAEFKDLGHPILIGPSRKSFLGGAVTDRLEGSLAAAMAAMMNGADIVRVHDVQPTVRIRNFLCAYVSSQ